MENQDWGAIFAENSGEVASEMETQAALEDAINEKAAAEGEGEVAEEAETVETKVELENNDAKFASKFAALSKKEKAVRQREAEVNAKLAEMEAKMKAWEESQTPKQEVKEEVPLEWRLKSNPLETLKEMGLSYEALTDMVLNGGKLPQDMQLDLVKSDIEKKYEAKIKELESRLDNDIKAREEEKYTTVINNFVKEIDNFVSNNENYELIQANNASDLVFQVIESHYKDTGRILSTKEAADHVEQHLEEEAKKLLRVKKLQNSLQPSKVTEPSKSKSQAPTLTNTLSSQVSTPKDRELSYEELKQQAAAMLRWDD